jgi:hypothetical protein
MTTKQDWIDKMIAAGACDPSKGDHRVNTAYAGSYLEKFEIIDMAWALKLDDYFKMTDETEKEEFEKKYDDFSKTRNRFAREMRKDGWTIKCSSYTNVWDQKIFKLEGERPIQTQTDAGQTTLIPAEA